MNPKEFEALMNAPGNIRYEYFIKKVADWEEVWGLYDDGWVIDADEEGNRLLQLWPREEFAEHYASTDLPSSSPKKIDLYEFIDQWLPDMKKDNIKPAIFNNGIDYVAPEIDVLLCDLETELEKY